MDQSDRSVQMSAVCGPCSPPTIREPVGMRKPPAWVAFETVQLLKSPLSDQLICSGSCTPVKDDAHATRICAGSATKMPPLTSGAFGILMALEKPLSGDHE